MVEFNYRCHLDAVMKLMDANVLKYASWSLEAKQAVADLLGLRELRIAAVSEETNHPLVPFVSADMMSATMTSLLVHVSAALGVGLLGAASREHCLLFRRRTGLVRLHTQKGGSYVDVVMGKDDQGHFRKVQAHRLLCLAAMSSAEVLAWKAAGSRFVSRHGVGCGKRKNCCSPYHICPGTQADNWADLQQVNAAVKDRFKGKRLKLSTSEM